MANILIIVPAYNEADNILPLIHKLKEADNSWDILVINDGSTDNTSELAKSSGLAEVIDLPFNLGIGGCVQTGFKYAYKNNYDFALQFDGDGQHKIEEINKLLNIVCNNKADVAIGSRFVQKHEGYKSTSLRRIGIKVFQFTSYLMIRQKITDCTSGFRAYNKKTIKFLSENYPTDFPEPEIVIMLGRNRFIIKEVFTQMQRRQGGVSSISLAQSPYYMTKVLLAMFMASIRAKEINHERGVN
jgi:glycosyltransferase involved in cell wall biosynthesis